ncbi:hypothetical protein C7E12_21330, partial [Stenotrophomonas maltophilia]
MGPATLPGGEHQPQRGRGRRRIAIPGLRATVRRSGRHLGCSHADVGAWVAEQWGLPRYLVESISHSEDED